MTTLSVTPKEGGTLIITVGFMDADGVAFTPKTLTWSLSDTAGAIVNSRSRVAISAITPELTVVLSGRDLVYSGGAVDGARVFTVEGTFDSVYGSDLPFRDEVGFNVSDTVINPVVVP